MKRIFVGFVIAIIAAMTCFLAACGDKSGDKKSFDGRYETVAIVVEGTTYNVGDQIPENLVTEKAYTVRSQDMIVVIGKQSNSSIEKGSFAYQRSLGGGMETSSGNWFGNDDGSVEFRFTPGTSYSMELTDEGQLIFKREWRFKSDNEEHEISFILEKVEQNS